MAKPVASSDTHTTERVAQSKSSRNLLKSADELEASVYDALHGFDSQQRLVAGADEAKPSRPDARGWGKQPKGAARHHQRMDQVGLDGHAVGVDAAESASREVCYVFMGNARRGVPEALVDLAGSRAIVSDWCCGAGPPSAPVRAKC